MHAGGRGGVGWYQGRAPNQKHLCDVKSGNGVAGDKSTQSVRDVQYCVSMYSNVRYDGS